MEFLNRNAGAVQAIAAALTVLLALGALVGVKLQIDAADRIQRAQSARDIYREYLNLAISKPEFSSPDYCALEGTAQEGAYEHFVEYLLYTSEQVMTVSSDWDETFLETYKTHGQLLCELDASSYDEAVRDVLAKLKGGYCKTVPKCG